MRAKLATAKRSIPHAPTQQLSKHGTQMQSSDNLHSAGGHKSTTY